MITTRKTRNVLLILGALTFCLAMLPIASCGRIKDIDTAIWGTSDAPAEPTPGEAPPVLELIATGLAACGFGGMATWLRRSTKNGKARLQELEARIDRVERGLPRDHPNPSQN